MLRLLISCLLLVPAICANSQAKILTFAYTGSALNTSTQFGLSVPFNTPVSGQFKIDTDSPLIATGDPNVVEFHHQIVGGFTATFGGDSFVADDYYIKLLNDRPQPGGNPAVDFFTIQFDSGRVTGSPDPFPFTVNGVPLAVGSPELEEGFLELNFVGNSLYPGAAPSFVVGVCGEFDVH